MKRRRRRVTIDISELLAVAPALAKHDEHWRGAGYARAGARLWHRKDGTFTVRLVWRSRDALISTVTLTATGEDLF